MSTLAARLDDLPKPVWIAGMVLGFILFWPVGLAILAYLIWSGRMSCWRHEHSARWREERERMHERAHRWWHGDRAARGGPPSSGNRAFDEYREETLRRLEDEQREFRDFLDRLRHAKDKAEFDQFMDERRHRPEPPRSDAQPGTPPPVPPAPQPSRIAASLPREGQGGGADGFAISLNDAQGFGQALRRFPRRDPHPTFPRKQSGGRLF